MTFTDQEIAYLGSQSLARLPTVDSRDALDRLANGPGPDPDFAADLEAVLRSVGGVPLVPWAPS
ncbi:MAG: hypothetical protein ACRDZX_14735 [Acidimicrobiales bacterium]